MMFIDDCAPDLCGPPLVYRKSIDEIGARVESVLFFPEGTTVKYKGFSIIRRVDTETVPVTDGTFNERDTSLFEEQYAVSFYIRIQSVAFKAPNNLYPHKLENNRLINAYLIYLVDKNRILYPSEKDYVRYTDACISEIFANALAAALPPYPSALTAAELDMYAVWARETNGIEIPYAYEHALGSLSFDLSL